MKDFYFIPFLFCSLQDPQSILSLPDVSSLEGNIYATHQTDDHHAAVVVFLDEHTCVSNDKGQYVVNERGLPVQERHYKNYQLLLPQGMHTLLLESIAVDQDALAIVKNSITFLKERGFVADTLEENLGTAPLDLPELLYLYQNNSVTFYGIESQENIKKQLDVVFSPLNVHDPSSFPNIATAKQYCEDLEWLLRGRSTDMAMNSVALSKKKGVPVVLTIGWEHAPSIEKALQSLDTDYVIIDPLPIPPEKTLQKNIETCLSLVTKMAKE